MFYNTNMYMYVCIYICAYTRNNLGYGDYDDWLRLLYSVQCIAVGFCIFLTRRRIAELLQSHKNLGGCEATASRLDNAQLSRSLVSFIWSGWYATPHVKSYTVEAGNLEYDCHPTPQPREEGTPA